MLSKCRESLECLGRFLSVLAAMTQLESMVSMARLSRYSVKMLDSIKREFLTDERTVCLFENFAKFLKK